jgi:hypothetical protein
MLFYWDENHTFGELKSIGSHEVQHPFSDALFLFHCMRCEFVSLIEEDLPKAGEKGLVARAGSLSTIIQEVIKNAYVN